MMVIKQLAAKLEGQFTAKLRYTLLNILRLNTYVFVVIKTYLFPFCCIHICLAYFFILSCKVTEKNEELRIFAQIEMKN